MGAVTSIVVLATTLVANAQTATSTASGSSATVQPMVLQVNKDGKVLMRGTIASVASGVLTVAGWGGTWTVNTPSTAEVLPAAVGNDITQFKTGDFVGIEGTVSQSASWTIDATLVRDWTYRRAVTAEQKQNVQAVRQTMQSETPRNYQGLVSGINGSSFTYTTADGTTYTVNIASDAKVLNRNWLTLPLSSIRNGDTVRVWGANASGTLTAEVVRDISIPAK